MCGGPVRRSYDNYYEREQEIREARQHEFETARAARAKKARAAKRRANALKAKRRTAALKGVATRRRNRAKAAKNAKPITVKPGPMLTVILKPTTQALPAIPRRKVTLTPMKARSLRMN
jgi:ATPase subunit of ABC transporter with duplicated ATPase domains